MSKIVGRRTLLRGIFGGLVASVALPPLAEMFDENGTAYAGGVSIPSPFGMFFWGGGVRPDRFFPAQTGANYPVTEELQPFADRGLLGDVSVVSGTDVKTAGVTTGHWTGLRAITCGAAKNGPYYDADGPLVHEVVADHWKGQTRFDKLEVSYSRVGMNPYDPEPFGETSPGALFDAVFGKSLPANMPAGDAQKARAAMFDALLMDGQGLLPKLGSESKAQLSKTLDAWSSLQKRVATPASACGSRPQRPSDPPYSRGHEDLEALNQTMSDILTVALACDLTRAFFIRHNPMQSDTVFWQVGSSQGLHELTLAGAYDEVNAAATFVMKQLAYFCKNLKDVPVGAGTQLDQCAILASSEYGDASAHDDRNMPVLVVGRAGGRLKSGLHVRGNGENVTRAHLTCLRAVGVPAPSFGKNGDFVLGYSDTTIPALEA
jgi:hypothetical protein